MTITHLAICRAYANGTGTTPSTPPVPPAPPTPGGGR